MAFGAETTTDEVLAGVDLSGKRFLVTGASAGLGVETIRALSAHGGEVVGTARDLGKAQSALAKAGVTGVDVVEVDLADLASVRRGADAIVAKGKKFDAIIGNAGVMACPQGKTADGFETQFGTNHLGHFVFVNRVAPLLKSPGRVVMLSSSGHRLSDVNLEDPGFETTAYQAFAAYGRSKTANAQFATGLDMRLKSRGIRAAAVHPGGIQTELGRHLTPDDIAQLRAASSTSGIKYKTIPAGAATSVWAATVAPADAIGGKFCQDCGVAAIDDSDARWGGVRSYALDPKKADALWAKSEEMVGEQFRY